MNRTCILVSPYFPPSTLAGVHRARHLAKHLPAAGWKPIVVCVDEAYYEERLDRALAALVPDSVEIVRVNAIPAGLTRPFGLGEISLRARGPLRRSVRRLLETRPIDAVLITGSPYYPMQLAPEIKDRFGVPVILDFQDPWIYAGGARAKLLSKRGISYRLATWLEPLVVRAADFITSVSEIQNTEMARRYEWLDRSKMAAIPIGGDPDDYKALRTLSSLSRDFPFDEKLINLSYVGTIWPPVIETIRVLMRAVAQLRRRMPTLYEKIRLNFVGTSSNPNDRAGHWVRPLAEAEGVAGIIREMAQRVCYLEALYIQAHSTGIIILGSEEPHYTASKIYSVLMSGRPFLSAFHRDSSAHAILSRAGGGIALSFASRAELSELEESICDSLARLAASPESLGKPDPLAYSAYEARAIAQRYAAIFDKLHRARASRQR